MKINGIGFEDWAAAAANIAHGMPEEEVCKILGIEMPVWADTNVQWGEKMADLMASDMEIAMKYGEIFQNPKVGKFANVGDTTNMEEVLQKVPDWDTFVKITEHQSKAAEVGLDAGEIIDGYGLSLQQWGQVGMHYSNWVKENIQDGNASEEDLKMFNTANLKWQAYFEEFYKDKGVDLGEDIDF